MPEEEEEPEAEGEEVEGEGEDGEPKPPSLPIPGAEDQFEQLNELLRNNQVEPLVAIEQLNGMLQRGQIGAYKYDMLFVKVWAKALDERGDAPFTTMENRRGSNAKTPPSARRSLGSRQATGVSEDDN